MDAILELVTKPVNQSVWIATKKIDEPAENLDESHCEILNILIYFHQ